MDTILAALRDVIDPDVGINIVDLGLVERAGAERVELIMTSPVCPQGDYIAAQCRDALAVRGLTAEVAIVDSPEWGPERMSALARQAMGWDMEEDG